MPYVTSIERLARKEGREEGARDELLAIIETTLEDKFGADGLSLMTRALGIEDMARLRLLNRELIRAQTLPAISDSLGPANKE